MTLAPSDQQPTGIRARILAGGALVSAGIAATVSAAELLQKHGVLIGSQQIPPAALSFFFLLIVAYRLAGRFRARVSPHELLVIYCMALVSALVASRGIVETVLPMLVSAGYFADNANRWQSLFFPSLKHWMVVFDPAGEARQPVTRHYFEGLPPGESTPWAQWIVPLITWSVLCLLILTAFLCLAALLRRQWVHNERLPFPLAQPVIELVTNRDQPLRRQLAMWFGFAIPCVIYTLNGLHNMVPSLPTVPVQQPVTQWLTSPPWTALHGITAYFSYAALGFAFLLPTQILLSLWFFYWFVHLQEVAAVWAGLQPYGMPTGYPCTTLVGYQTMGAYMVLAAAMLYAARGHLGAVIRRAWRPEDGQDLDEVLPLRKAMWGVALSFVGILTWCCLAGMTWWVAILQMGVFLFVVALVMSRATAEAGLFMTETSFKPIDIYRLFAPVQSLGPANLSVMAMLDGAFLRDQRGLVLTGMLDAMKLGEGLGPARRHLWKALGIATLLALVVAMALQVWIPYTTGAHSLYWYPFNGNNLWALTNYQSFMQGNDPMPRDWQLPTFFGVGVVSTVALLRLNAAFYWWPLHPLGYALSGSWSMVVLWFPCLLAWLIKSAVVRYGGMRLFITLRPFFIGLLLGECVMAVLWTLLSVLTGAPAPAFPFP